ncbi:MAG: ATP-dependent Clp protease ATP-binding subunit [Chloroflexota bacterium]|nr:ATP-dependent Clp protease ATP-binding subunit [Chloroflexota bacterium]
MADNLDKFTKRARKALTIAQQEAQRLHHNYIGTEHILLGIIREEKSAASKVLRDLGVSFDRVESLIGQTGGQGRRPVFGRMGLTPRTKRVIELAAEEAQRMGHHYIDTEHLLLGLVRHGDGVAMDVLRKLGVNPDAVRNETAKVLIQNPVYVGEKKKDGQKTPTVDQLAIDLTALAEQGKLDPVVGRGTEIERVIQILSRRTKNNPALIGEPGVGKTAIVEGLAQRIVGGVTPEPLLDKRLLQLDVGSLVAGTMYRGQFEERLKKVINELKDSSSILFIDELHMLVGAGSAGSSVDAANILKPALARGELQCIGATTMEEYRKHIEGDAALERRFQPVMVNEPTVEETVDILRGVKDRYEAHHRLRITDDAIRAAAHLAARYITDRFLPDKAIDLMDEASARVRMYKAPQSSVLQQALGALREVQHKKGQAIADQDFELAASLRYREVELEREVKQARLSWEQLTELPDVTADDIAEIVAMWTGIPVSRIAAQETERLLKMEETLHKRVVGQDEAVETIAKAVRRARAGLKDPSRPISTLIFLGPTGVGKTELAKALAEFLFGSEDALLQLDMSEFMERHAVARLVGAPPGYVGYEDAGQLTEHIRRRPYSVVCFDEVEKAHAEAFNMLLQIMEEGHLSDARGRTVDFRNAIIIMTSNVGAEIISRSTSLGFATQRDEAQSEAEAYERMRRKLLGELKKMFRPEFLNRVDGVIVFHALNRDHIKQIVGLELNKIRGRLAENAVELRVTDAAMEFLADEGYSPEFGARHLRRAIQHKVEDALSEGILAGEFQPGDVVQADLEKDEIVMRVVERRPIEALPEQEVDDTAAGDRILESVFN